MESRPTAFRLFAVDAGQSGIPSTIRQHGSAPTFGDVVRRCVDERDDRITHIVVVAPDVILHRSFTDEIDRALCDPALIGIDWVALCSDGHDVSGRRIDAGNYLEDPATPGKAALRLAGGIDPALMLIDQRRLAQLLETSPPLGDQTEMASAAAAHAMGVYLSQNLRFSAIEPRPAPPEPGGRISLEGLRSIRSDPTVSVVVRTTMTRPAMLIRNLRSIAAQTVPPHEVIIVSTHDDVEGVEPLVHQHDVRGLPLVIVRAPDIGPSRTAALAAGMDAAKSDYVWFVDDDDWAAPRAIEAVVTAVHANDRPIIVGAVESETETWDEGDLMGSSFIRRYDPAEWYRAFTGWNHLPNCAVVLPTALARSRLSVDTFRSDLGEDYALQLLLFTSPGTSVTVVDETIAHVSVRSGDDNTVTLEDRTPWLRDLGSHISDLSNDDLASTAAFWHLGRAVRQIPYPAPTAPGTDAQTAEEITGPRRSFPWRRR